MFGYSSTFQCGNEHSAPNLHPDFVYRIDIREDVSAHGAIWCKCRSRTSEWLLPLTFRFLDSLLLCVLKSVAQKVVRLSVLALHDRYSHAGNYIGLLSNTALFLSAGCKIPLPLSTPLNPLWLLATAPVSSLPCLASKFRNRSCWSVLLFIIVFYFW